MEACRRFAVRPTCCGVDWDRLRVFHVVASTGSFTKAGVHLSLSQSAVSRQVGALEEALKVSLFYRHTRGLLLTEQGEAFFESLRAIEDQITSAISQVCDSKIRSEGPLSISTTVAFGSVWLSSRINRFHQRYPEIAVSLALSDLEEPDLFARQADVAIRFERQTHPRLVQLRLMPISYRLVASAEYLGRHGVPLNPEDLDHHDLIVYGEERSARTPESDFLLGLGMPAGRRREPALRINSSYGMYRAVCGGLGIAALPDFLLEETPALTQVLPGLDAPVVDAYFVYPEELRSSRRVAVIRDFLLEEASASVPASGS